MPNHPRVKFLATLAAVAALVPSPVFAWGKTGHRVVAAIAETELSGLARANIEQILGPGESLDEAVRSPRRLTPDDLRLLYTVGDLLSIAIERARLFAQSAQFGASDERNRLARGRTGP